VSTFRLGSFVPGRIWVVEDTPLFHEPLSGSLHIRASLRQHLPLIRVDEFYALVELIAEPYASMVYAAVFTGLRVSELAGLLWHNVHADSITVEQRYCRGDWDEPKSDASRATIAVDDHVIDRIQKLKSIEIVVRAGKGQRRYKAVKSDKPGDLVFQSVKTGAPIR
jgi:integrase